MYVLVSAEPPVIVSTARTLPVSSLIYVIVAVCLLAVYVIVVSSVGVSLGAGGQ
ncbi:hypothetical protein ACDP95_03635 [Weissella confusa]